MLLPLPVQLLERRNRAHEKIVRWPPFGDDQQQSTRYSAEPVGGVLEQRRAGLGAPGGTPSHRLGRQIDRQKIFNIKYTAALNGRRSMILNATTNQKLAAAMKGSMEGRFGKREVQGKRNSNVLGVLDVELKVKT